MASSGPRGSTFRLAACKHKPRISVSSIRPQSSRRRESRSRLPGGTLPCRIIRRKAWPHERSPRRSVRRYKRGIFTMSRKPQTIDFWCGRLPHWEVEDGRYFITIHLAGAIPLPGRLRLRQLSQEAGKINDRLTPAWLRVQRMIFQEMERWLDRAEVVSHLRHPQIAAMVSEAI